MKTTAFDLQVNPAGPGLGFHMLEKSKDKNFWSVRASSDIRIIIHKTEGSLLLCYSVQDIVALHRAVHLARTRPEARVLPTTFSDTLANALHTKLKRIVGSEPRLAERIDVHSLNAIGLRLYKSHCGPVNLASRELVRELLGEASKTVGGHKFSQHFLLTEWEQVVDAWQLETWESYRDVAPPTWSPEQRYKVRRLGRKTRLPEA